MPLLQPLINIVTRKSLLRSTIRQINHRKLLVGKTVHTNSLVKHLSTSSKLNEAGECGKNHKVEGTDSSYGNLVAEDDIDLFDREFVDLKTEDYEIIYKDDPTGETKTKIEQVLREYEYRKYESLGRVPATIKPDEMRKALEECSTPHSRQGWLEYLFKVEMAQRAAINRKKREKAEKAVLRAEREAKFAKLCSSRSGLTNEKGDLIYGLWHNILFPRIHENRIKSGTSSSNLIEAALFGSKLVFDFDYEDHMIPYVNRNALDQVQEACGLNKFHFQGVFDMWFCNLRSQSKTRDYLVNHAMKELDRSMVTVKEDCFTNYFDKSRLVYLSPDAKDRLTKVGDNDDVYVIGVYNDRTHKQPLSYRKAVSLGIRCKKLPLDNHVAWSSGSKSLCVNHVVGILLEAYNNGSNWKEALVKHIPKRKIKPIETVREEEVIREKRRRRLSPGEEKGWKPKSRRTSDWEKISRIFSDQ